MRLNGIFSPWPKWPHDTHPCDARSSLNNTDCERHIGPITECFRIGGEWSSRAIGVTSTVSQYTYRRSDTDECFISASSVPLLLSGRSSLLHPWGSARWQRYLSSLHPKDATLFRNWKFMSYVNVKWNLLVSTMCMRGTATGDLSAYYVHCFANYCNFYSCSWWY